MRKRVTIKDIARELGISTATVSRALSGKPNVKEETRKMVFDKARELGYMVYHSARALRTKKTMTVGIIVSDIRNPFFLDFLDGAEKVLFGRKYKILLSTSDEDANKELVYLRWLTEHGVDGIMLSPAADEKGKGNLGLLRRLERDGIPVVLYDRIYEEAEDEFDSVTIDNRGAIVDALIYLKEMGHRRVGIVLADTRIYTIKKRYEGYLEGCELLNLECPEDLVLNLEQPFHEGLSERIRDFLKSSRMSAVVTTNHILTKKIYKCAKMLNLSIPEDLSVVGFDDVEENEFFDPPVTVIRQPVIQIGKTAATLLLGRIDGERYGVQNVVLKPELVIRKSVCHL